MSTILNPPGKGLPILQNLAAEQHSAGPITDVTNPGDTHPHSQQFIAPNGTQGTKVTHIPGGIANSDGQMQQKNLNPGRNGVTVTRIKGSTVTGNGEIQIPIGRFKLDQGVKATRAHKGLAENVNAGSQGFSHPIQSYAKKLPIAVDVSADNNRPGGLPRNVMIK